VVPAKDEYQECDEYEEYAPRGSLPSEDQGGVQGEERADLEREAASPEKAGVLKPRGTDCGGVHVTVKSQQPSLSLFGVNGIVRGAASTMMPPTTPTTKREDPLTLRERKLLVNELAGEVMNYCNPGQGKGGYHRRVAISINEIRNFLLKGTEHHSKRYLFLDLADWFLADKSKVFKRFDEDGSGSIEMRELKALTHTVQSPEPSNLWLGIILESQLWLGIILESQLCPAL